MLKLSIYHCVLLLIFLGPLPPCVTQQMVNRFLQVDSQSLYAFITLRNKFWWRSLRFPAISLWMLWRYKFVYKLNPDAELHSSFFNCMMRSFWSWITFKLKHILLKHKLFNCILRMILEFTILRFKNVGYGMLSKTAIKNVKQQIS